MVRIPGTTFSDNVPKIDWEKEYCKLRNTLNDLYLLVKHETNLPESAANGVESQGLDEGIVRASDIMEEVRVCLVDFHFGENS